MATVYPDEATSRAVKRTACVKSVKGAHCPAEVVPGTLNCARHQPKPKCPRCDSLSVKYQVERDEHDGVPVNAYFECECGETWAADKPLV